jgi:Glycosyl hydrolases family 16
VGYGVAMVMTELDERFDRGTLDPGVWFPWYLPHWGGAGAAATWQVDRDGLRLSIPPDQGLWCPDVHDEPLRVSCIQSAHLDGQQPFRDGLTVVDPRPEFRGYTPRYGRIEVRMRATISHRSMFAFWLSGIEDQPERSGEICVAEIFGTAAGDGTAGVGMGVHAFRDPALREDFATVPLALDVARHHTYGVDWRPGALAFAVDGEVVRRVEQAPDYPVQLMLGVFDFPARATQDDTGVPVPDMVVAHVRGSAG